MSVCFFFFFNNALSALMFSSICVQIIWLNLLPFRNLSPIETPNIFALLVKKL